jgi:lysophospholipase L1-like esterase
MKHLLPTSLLLLAGCGLSTAPHATQNAPTETANYQRIDTARTVFIGDQITVNMFTPTFQQQHPNWTNAGVAGETTAQALAAFQAQCISPRPQVCHVMIGLNDIQAWLPYPPGDPRIESQEVQVLQDLSQMLQEAAAANIQVVFATEFPSLEDYTSIDSEASVDIYANNIDAWMTGFEDMYWPSTWPAVPATATIANYWGVLTGGCEFAEILCDYLPGLSSDDVTPNAAGYSAMYPVMQAALEKAALSARTAAIR